jgi:hypothetical protein
MDVLNGYKDIIFIIIMDNKIYTCEICSKNYKTYKSMWHHKNKYHEKNDQKMTSIPTKNDHCLTNNDQSENNLENITEIKLTDNTICIYCDKKLSAYTHLRRHLKTCKEKERKLIEYDELKKEHSEMKKNFEELKTIMLEMMNNKYKMHPKKMQKIINTTNNNNTNSHNNITINNQINIIELGDEKLNDIFSKEEKLKILKRGYSSLEEIIRYTHLNDKYIQFQNIIITNSRNNQAYMYNNKLGKFILCDKKEILEELIIYRMDDLLVFYDEHKNKLEPKLRTNLEKMFQLKDDDEYGKRKRDEFNILFYNESNKDLLKIKKDNENENILF